MRQREGIPSRSFLTYISGVLCSVTIRTTCSRSSSCSFCNPWANRSISVGFPVHSFPFAAPLDFFRWWSSVVSSFRFLFSSGAGGGGAGGAGVGGAYPGVSPDSAKSLRRPGEGLLNSWRVNQSFENWDIPQCAWCRTWAVGSGDHGSSLSYRLSLRNAV